MSGGAGAPVAQVSGHVWRVRLPCDTLPPYDHVNAYVVADGGVAIVVDPGSDRQEALDLLREALDAARARLVKGIALTHTHPDHVDGIPLLAAFEGERNGSAPRVLAHAAEAARLPGEANVTYLADGRVLTVGDVTVTALHTPGHSPGHLTFDVRGSGGDTEVALVGDLAVADGSVWVGLPEGDVGAYLDTLARLEALGAPLLGPGHGDMIVEPRRRLEELAAHRLERESQVLAALGPDSLDATEITRRVYPGHPEAVLALAEQSVLAHLVKLMREMKVVHLGEDERGPFALRR